MYTGEVVSLSEQQLISCDHAKPYDDAVSELVTDCIMPAPLSVFKVQNSRKYVLYDQHLTPRQCRGHRAALSGSAC